MKNKKNLVIVIILAIVILIGLFIYSGNSRTDVYLIDFKVSDDNKIMTLKVGVSNSSGYIRKMKRTSGSMNYYYTFYQTFGINSKIGSKDTFEIELDNNVNEIYFYTGRKGYKLVLVRNTATSEWEKINYSVDGTFKLNLLDKEDIIKVGINTYALNDNYFEYSNKYIIEKIYNIFDDLETEIVSKTYNPENPEEMYMIKFICDETKAIYSDKLRVDTYVEVYRKNGKYYAEQSYNGIYEITEEDFNIVKSFVK